MNTKRVRCSRRSATLIVAAAALLVTSCGTRLPDSAFQTSTGQVGAGSSASDSSGTDGAGGSIQAGTTGGAVPGAGGTSGAMSSASSGGSTGPAAGATPSGVSSGSNGGNPASAGVKAGPSSPGSQASGPAATNTASDVGVTATSITVGNITAIGGPLGPEIFSPSLYGAEAYFDALNAAGGVNGRKINFITCDDQEDPNLDVSCAQKLIQNNHVFALVGNDTDNETSAGYTNSQKVPDVGDFCIGNACTEYPYLFSWSGGLHYPRDGKNVGQNGTMYAPADTFLWFKQNLGVTKAAICFYNIPISREAGLLEAQELQAVGINVVYYCGGTNQGVNPAAPTYDTDAIQMKNDGVQLVANAIDIGGFEKLCQSENRYGFAAKANFTTSQGMGQLVGKSFADPCRSSIYGEDYSQIYSDTSNPVVASMNAAMHKYFPNVLMHQWVLDGWVAAMEFTDAVRSMGADVTRAGLVRWYNGLNGNTFGGIVGPVSYGNWNYSQPNPLCVSVGQWNDQANSFVSRSPVTCVQSKWLPYQAQNTGGS